MKNIGLYLGAYFAVATLAFCGHRTAFGVDHPPLGVFARPTRALDAPPAERCQDGDEGGQHRGTPRLESGDHASWPPAF
ncbi:hypothetical protein [Lysobacter antibioticus]|uniref:hypothetical protein n=1 Tax=Lysobacter antibioticus TaxID=84531 RepID=UPI0007E8B856|nr:hypothetical protein [Lysobacter antibioticus]